MIYDIEKQLRENGPKLEEADRTAVQDEIDRFKKVREGGKPEEIKPAIDQMTEKVYAIFGKLYQQQDDQQPPEGGTADFEPHENPDGTVNAEGDVQ